MGTGSSAVVVVAASRPRERFWPRILSRYFGSYKHDAAKESVATSLYFAARLDRVWEGLLFYEEVPGRPPFPLNVFLPDPVRTEGGKGTVGASVRCIYQDGDLVKCVRYRYGDGGEHAIHGTSASALDVAAGRKAGDGTVAWSCAAGNAQGY